MQEIILNHPMVEHKISLLRCETTSTKEFRELVGEIATILCLEALKDAKLKEIEIKTPIANTKGLVIDENNYAFVPILRAGMGMVDGVLTLMPNAKIGHIGLYRNEETLEPVEYYCKLPKNIEDKTVILLDPMLATGGSGSNAISMLKKRGVKKIKFLSGQIFPPAFLQKIYRNCARSALFRMPRPIRRAYEIRPLHCP